MGRKKKSPSPEPPLRIEQVTESIPIPWNNVIAALFTYEPKLLSKLSKGQKTFAQYIWWQREIALHWLIKLEWNSRHQIPTTPKIKRLSKPKGEVLRRFFLLCERCHTLRGANLSYSQAADWFGLFFFEQTLQQIIGGITDKRGPKANRPKQRLIRKQKKFIRKLKDLENPFLLNNEKGEAYKGLMALPRLRASCDLIETAIGIVEQPDANIFRKKYWIPLISALEKEVESWKSKDFGVLSIENYEAKLQVGQGRHKVIVSPLW